MAVGGIAGLLLLRVISEFRYPGLQWNLRDGQSAKRPIKNVDDGVLRMGVYGKRDPEDIMSRRTWGVKRDMAGSDLLRGSHSASGGGRRY